MEREEEEEKGGAERERATKSPKGERTRMKNQATINPRQRLSFDADSTTRDGERKGGKGGISSSSSSSSRRVVDLSLGLA